MLQYYVMR